MMKLGESRSQLVGQQPKKLPQYIAAISVCMGSVAAGTVLGWISNISNEMKLGKFNDIYIDEDNISWIGSIATLGALLMCFPIGFICDLIGRKLAMLLLIFPFMLGWLLIIFSENVDMIYAGRFFTGMAGGAFCVSAPLYTSEISQNEIRGTLGSYFQLFLTVGILLSYLFPLFCSPLVHTILCAIFPLIFGVAFIFQPETPVYLMKKNKPQEAIAALIRFRGGRGPFIEQEIESIKASLEEEKKYQVPFFQAIRKPAAKKASLICFALMFFQQMGGINAVIFYTGDIFTASGVSLDSQIATVIVGAVQVVSTFVSSLVVDRLGRKILLLISDFFMAVSGIMLGIFFTLAERKLVNQDTLDTLGFLPILALCIFMIVFSLGFGPIPWMLSSEMFPPEIKAVASSGAGTLNWFLAFIVTKFYFDLKTAIGGDVTFYIFSGISLLGTAFILFLVPETKGKSFDEIQRLLGDKTKTKQGIDNPGYTK